MQLKSLHRRVSATRNWFARPNLYDQRTQDRVGVVFTAPSEMTITERLYLYATVRGLRPDRVLEIGTRHGGSASIMAAAMEDVGKGQITGVDPAPKITVPQHCFFGRFQLIEKPSPDALPEAADRAGGLFDLALIDGLHIYDQAKKDLAGVLPHMKPGSHILLHDAFHFGLSEAIRETLESNPDVQDCGYVCAKPAVKVSVLAYGGLRLLRLGERIVDPNPILARSYGAAGKSPPPLTRSLINHDPWYCRTVEPCEYCRKMTIHQKNESGDKSIVAVGSSS